MNRLWLAAALTLCAGATASAYDLTALSGHGRLSFLVDGKAATTAAEGQAVTVTVAPGTGWQTQTVTARAYDSWGAAKARGGSRSIDLLTVTPAGGGNTWTFTMPAANVEVAAGYRKLLSHPDITVSIPSATYNGLEQRPAVTVRDGSTLLTAGTDYTVVGYANNVNAGTATVTVAAAGGQYAGETTASFTIAARDLGKATVAITPTSYDYDGTPRRPAVLAVIVDGTLIDATDYTVDYADNVNAGTATVTVTGTGNCGGTATAEFTIRPVTVIDDNVSVTYSGSATALTIHDAGTQPGSTVEEGLEVTTLSYYRTLTGSDVDAYTVCLPYAPPTAAGLTYYTLTGVEGTTLLFDEIAGAPQAFTPYLVFASSGTDIGVENLEQNITMSQTVANTATAGGYTLKGTLTGLSHDEAQGCYILQAGNRWAPVGSDTHAYLPPFRAYIEAAGNVRPTLDSSFGGQHTGLSALRATGRDGAVRWFDLRGRRVESPARGGVYIRNGRKEVVR